MKWLDAIEQILSEADEQLHYGELARRIMTRSLVDTSSQTPDITVHASVGQDIRRRRERGFPPRFTIDSGVIGLAEWSAPALKEAQDVVEQVRNQAHRDLMTELRKLDGTQFESFLEVLLIRMGYEVEVIGGAGDDGIDLVAESGGGVSPQRIGIQAKCLGSNRRVGPNVVRVLRDALPTKECQSGAIISTARFDDRAVEVAKEPGRLAIQLTGPDELAELAARYGAGISSRPIELLYENLEEVFSKST